MYAEAEHSRPQIPVLRPIPHLYKSVSPKASVSSEFGFRSLARQRGIQ